MKKKENDNHTNWQNNTNISFIKQIFYYILSKFLYIYNYGHKKFAYFITDIFHKGGLDYTCTLVFGVTNLSKHNDFLHCGM